MDGHSSHLTAPVRSRSSQSPSASATSSIHKRKLPPEDHAPLFPPSLSDTRDGALTSNDDLESISVRGADDSDSDDETEEEEEYDNSMRNFTASRLENSNAGAAAVRNSKIKAENPVKTEPADLAKDGVGNNSNSGGGAAVGANGSVPGIVVKEDTVKSIFTDNIQTSGAYSAREENLKREEESGNLSFVCASNDGIDQHMIWLVGLKKIFARQLPNMPREYIVRLLMDRNHKSVMVIRGTQVVGGITYRPYISQKFGEIAFCAITADEQFKGYGTRLMNHLKQHARDVDGLTHFITYADNNAVGYFKKQGFTAKEIYLEKERWHGYIKDYDGGSLMECKIDPKLPYTDLSTMIRRQRQAIDEKIRELSNCHIVYPGIDFQKEDKTHPEEMAESEMCTESIVTAEKRRISPETELPNTKRRQTSVSGISDPSRITQLLVNDPTIMGLAHKLAEDLGFVQMAKELLLSLQGAGAEHLLSLQIWHNQQLLDALEQYQLMPTMKEVSQEDPQHIEERMVRIMEHPFLKPLLGEREDFSLIRVAIIILLAYWIHGDNVNETLEDVLSIDEQNETPEDVLSIDEQNETLEDVLSIDEQDGSEDTGSCINLDESIIFELVEHPYIKDIACEVESGSGLAIILDELLNSVRDPRASLHDDCMEHFKIVKMAWVDNQLISSLLKPKDMIYMMDLYSRESRRQLRETLTPLIKDHPPMKDILLESDSVRGALTIIIGYFSAKNMILGFDDVMGRGGSFGIRTVRYSDTVDDMKVEPTPESENGAFMKPYSPALDTLMPDPSLVTQLLHDASFKEVAHQIQGNGQAVKFKDIVLDCDTYNSDYVFRFWQHVSLIYLRRVLKKSPQPSLFNLFKELSDGAEMLRLRERLNRIRGDSYLKTIDQNSDFSLRMRFALSILIGYWSSIDVAWVAMSILDYQLENPSKAHLLEDLRDVEIICYWADSNHDLEGLKNVLAGKYDKDSPELKHRVEKIGEQQKLKVAEAVGHGYDNTEAQITALLKGGSCIWISSFSWFSETCHVI